MALRKCRYDASCVAHRKIERRHLYSHFRNIFLIPKKYCSRELVNMEPSYEWSTFYYFLSTHDMSCGAFRQILIMLRFEPDLFHFKGNPSGIIPVNFGAISLVTLGAMSIWKVRESLLSSFLIVFRFWSPVYLSKPGKKVMGVFASASWTIWHLSFVSRVHLTATWWSRHFYEIRLTFVSTFKFSTRIWLLSHLRVGFPNTRS